jgi:hypothetical protein
MTLAIQDERGSIAPLVAGYLALILLTVLGSATVGTTMIATNRIQAVADATVLYAHDRSINRGIPDNGALRSNARQFLSIAPSAQRITLTSLTTRVSGAISEIELCAVWADPVGVNQLGVGQITICRSAKAESFIVP